MLAIRQDSCGAVSHLIVKPISMRIAASTATVASTKMARQALSTVAIAPSLFSKLIASLRSVVFLNRL